MISIFMILSQAVLHADPRVTCENLVTGAPKLRKHLIETRIITPLESERTAIIPGGTEKRTPGVLGRLRRIFEESNGRSDVAVVVLPTGEPLAFDPLTHARYPVRPDKAIEVREFGDRLITGRDINSKHRLRWTWERKVPRALLSGDLSKGKFLTRNSAAVERLLQSRLWDGHMISAGIAWRASHMGRDIDVFEMQNHDGRSLFALFAPGLESGVDYPVASIIRLENGSRLLRHPDRWVPLPAENALKKLSQTSPDSHLAHFAAVNPRALERMFRLFTRSYRIDLNALRMIPVQEEQSSDFYDLVVEEGREPRPLALFDGSRNAWVLPTSVIDRTFRALDGRRFGLNFNGNQGWENLPLTGTLGVVRAAYPDLGDLDTSADPHESLAKPPESQLSPDAQPR